MIVHASHCQHSTADVMMTTSVTAHRLVVLRVLCMAPPGLQHLPQPGGAYSTYTEQKSRP